MSGDDELRRRLQEIPAPRSGIDVDAVVGAARRRRRPKVAALTAAATGAGVLIVAPFVAPGLSPLQPTSGPASMSEHAPGEDGTVAEDRGAESAGDEDAGAAPEAAQPTESGADGAETADTPCGLTRAGDVGLALRFLEGPADARIAAPGTVEAEGAGLSPSIVTFVGVDALVITGSTAEVVAGSTEQDARLAQGDATVLGVTTGVLVAEACGPGTPSAASPVALLSLDGAPPLAVVGEPFEGR